MKNKFAALALTFIAVFGFTGCVTATHPAAVIANGVTNAPAALYVVSPSLSNTLAEIQLGISAVAPVLAATPAAPAVPFLPSLASGIFFCIAGISGFIAKRKNDAAAAAQLSADNHAAAAAALAATVASLNSATVPAVATAINYATQNGSSAAVAAHLADAANPVQTANPAAARI